MRRVQIHHHKTHSSKNLRKNKKDKSGQRGLKAITTETSLQDS